MTPRLLFLSFPHVSTAPQIRFSPTNSLNARGFLEAHSNARLAAPIIIKEIEGFFRPSASTLLALCVFRSRPTLQFPSAEVPCSLERRNRGLPKPALLSLTPGSPLSHLLFSPVGRQFVAFPREFTSISFHRT